MRWIFYVEGFFYTCSCPENLRVRFTLSLLRLVPKDWWKFLTADYSLAKHIEWTWERLNEMFRDEFVPVVEREREKGVGLGVPVSL